MRILVLTNMYPPHHYGGYELSCQDVVARWRGRGHEVHVLTTDMRVPSVEDPRDEPGVYRELQFYWDQHDLTSPGLPRRLMMERSNQRRLGEAMAEFRPDVVSAWQMAAMSLGLLNTVVDRDLPLVLVVCDDWLLYASRLDAWSRLFVRRRRLGRVVSWITGLPTSLPDLGSDVVACFNSQWIRARALQAAPPMSPRIATVVYSGIDTTDFPPNDRPESDWRGRLLTVGRLEERKGVHVALEALASLPPETTLEIIGRGDQRYVRRLHEIADRLDISHRVSYADVARSELRARYEAADALLFPVVWEEPFGLVPLEAMACGTPVVATATGGSAEYLLDGINCLRISPGDGLAIAEAVERLASDAPLRRRLSTVGGATAKAMNVDRLAEDLEVWHQAAADRFASGRPAESPSPVERLVALGVAIPSSR